MARSTLDRARGPARAGHYQKNAPVGASSDPSRKSGERSEATRERASCQHARHHPPPGPRGTARPRLGMSTPGLKAYRSTARPGPGQDRSTTATPARTSSPAEDLEGQQGLPQNEVRRDGRHDRLQHRQDAGLRRREVGFSPPMKRPKGMTVPNGRDRQERPPGLQGETQPPAIRHGGTTGSQTRLAARYPYATSVHGPRGSGGPHDWPECRRRKLNAVPRPARTPTRFSRIAAGIVDPHHQRAPRTVRTQGQAQPQARCAAAHQQHV